MYDCPCSGGRPRAPYLRVGSLSLMRTQQQTPVDTGTKSTEADAVHVAGKAKARKGRVIFSSN